MRRWKVFGISILNSCNKSYLEELFKHSNKILWVLIKMIWCALLSLNLHVLGTFVYSIAALGDRIGVEYMSPTVTILIINDLRATDAGQYACTLGPLTSTLEIAVAPSGKVYFTTSPLP